jgi:hypothetical protein
MIKIYLVKESFYGAKYSGKPYKKRVLSKVS